MASINPLHSTGMFQGQLTVSPQWLIMPPRWSHSLTATGERNEQAFFRDSGRRAASGFNCGDCGKQNVLGDLLPEMWPHYRSIRMGT
jgi:hypothetical protein